MTLKQAMHLTMPQIILLGHAAKCNSDRMDERIEKDRKKKDKADKEKEKLDKRDPILPQFGKRMSECTSDEIAGQFVRGAW